MFSPPQPLKSHVRTYSPLDTNESEWQVSQIGLQFLVTSEHFMSGKLKIRCSASIYDIYWQSTEVSAEEDRPRVIHYEPAATIVGINYLQPPPNFQTGQKKPDGQVGVKGKVSSLLLIAFVWLQFYYLKKNIPINSRIILALIYRNSNLSREFKREQVRTNSFDYYRSFFQA